jgi:hypothetical protein
MEGNLNFPSGQGEASERPIRVDPKLGVESVLVNFAIESARVQVLA